MLYKATRMVLTRKGPTRSQTFIFKSMDGEPADARHVAIAPAPFRSGTRDLRRLVERPSAALTGDSGTWRAAAADLVAKESRAALPHGERISFHRDSALCATRAAALARDFNRAVCSKAASVGTVAAFAAPPSVEVAAVRIYRLRDARAPGGFRYAQVEPRLDTVVNHDDPGVSVGSDAAHTFSHYTYEATSGQEIVLGLRGEAARFVCPRIHSIRRRFGKNDRGAAAAHAFFQKHTCNSFCAFLGLRQRSSADIDLTAADEIIDGDEDVVDLAGDADVIDLAGGDVVDLAADDDSDVVDLAASDDDDSVVVDLTDHEDVATPVAKRTRADSDDEGRAPTDDEGRAPKRPRQENVPVFDVEAETDELAARGAARRRPAAGMITIEDATATLEASLARVKKENAARVQEAVEQKEEESMECPICMDGRKDTTLVPCGHVVCAACAGDAATCPTCRGAVSSTMRIYL
ncbi:hypothetical protein SO694_00105014 [Aureococcus anophagefferens]|uniref:Alpha-type protein kinase domain-containing protein n=1 Tax=Aureococcus anophagefferens TaxID=44056 RepID=A0ABR1FMD7_AURAN